MKPIELGFGRRDDLDWKPDFVSEGPQSLLRSLVFRGVEGAGMDVSQHSSQLFCTIPAGRTEFRIGTVVGPFCMADDDDGGLSPAPIGSAGGGRVSCLAGQEQKKSSQAEFQNR